MKNETINEIRENMMLEVSSWGGLSRTPGSNSTIITNDKKIYFYRKHFDFETKENKEELTSGKEISDESFNLIKTYIEEHYINKTFEPVGIFDASFVIKGPGFSVVNQFDEYKKIKDLINEIIKEDLSNKLN